MFINGQLLISEKCELCELTGLLIKRVFPAQGCGQTIPLEQTWFQKDRLCSFQPLSRKA